MGGPSILRYASLQTCEDIYQQCVESLAAGQGTIVISQSGGGESETRGGTSEGGLDVVNLMRAAMRRMSQIDPTKYPPISSTMTGDFSALSL